MPIYKYQCVNCSETHESLRSIVNREKYAECKCGSVCVLVPSVSASRRDHLVR